MAGVLEQHAGDGQPLLLAARQAVAPLADDGVVALGQGGDEVVDARRPARVDQLVVGGVGPGVAQVGADGVVEQVGVLGDHPDGARPGWSRVRSRTSWPSTRTAPDRHVVEAGDEVGQRGLARARRTDEGDHLPGLGGERDALEDPVGRLVAQRRVPVRLERGDRHGGAGRVAEPHVVDLDAARRASTRSTAPGAVVDGAGRVEHLEHPLEGDDGGHEVDPGVGEAGERRVDAGDVERRGRRACQW